MADKPDLIDDCSERGIEVTHPVDELQEKMASYFQNNLYGRTLDDVPSQGLAIFRAHSYDVLLDLRGETIRSFKSPKFPFDIEVLYCAINKKMKKLNKKLYSCSDNISLYLVTGSCSFEVDNYDVAQKLIAYIKKLEDKYTFHFKEIFYDCLWRLYRCDLLTSKIEEINLLDLIDAIDTRYKENLIENGEYNDQL